MNCQLLRKGFWSLRLTAKSQGATHLCSLARAPAVRSCNIGNKRKLQTTFPTWWLSICLKRIILTWRYRFSHWTYRKRHLVTMWKFVINHITYTKCVCKKACLMMLQNHKGLSHSKVSVSLLFLSCVAWGLGFKSWLEARFLPNFIEHSPSYLTFHCPAMTKIQLNRT